MKSLIDDERPIGTVPAALNALSGGLVRFERIISRLLVVGFTTLIVVNVTLRYLAGRPLIFAEEFAAILLVWLALVAVSISIHDRRQVGVTILVDALPPAARAVTLRLVDLIVLLILIVFLWKSIVWVASPSVGFERVITLGWAKWPFFLIVPIFCATSITHVAAQLVRR